MNSNNATEAHVEQSPSTDGTSPSQAESALAELVGVLLRADKQGGIWQALYNEGITDAYDQALDTALRVLGPVGVERLAQNYELDTDAVMERLANGAA
ncbi:hypothetical protein [Paraburkholderia sp. SIMBA_054]|uniref:hypothetical protein n=1 Tax=Paraburkholderia sp. SIMBA_054 TaxID=3085795 RepID=UPI00397C0C61